MITNKTHREPCPTWQPSSIYFTENGHHLAIHLSPRGDRIYVEALNYETHRGGAAWMTLPQLCELLYDDVAQKAREHNERQHAANVALLISLRDEKKEDAHGVEDHLEVPDSNPG